MQYVDAGFISRTHGLKGELKLKLSSPFSFKQLLQKKHLMVQVRGKNIPFAVENFNQTGADEVIVKFLDIHSQEEARKMLGLLVQAPENVAAKQKKSGAHLYQEFLLIDKNYGTLGLVEEVIEQPGHALLRITYKGQEVLIPAVEDFIVDVKPRKKELHLDLPEGLLNLNE